jgi:hypothetical protein
MRASHARSGRPGTAPRSLAIWLGALAAFGAGLALLAVAGVELDYLTPDPTEAGDEKPWFGFFSNLGLMLWAGAASVSGFAGYVLWRSGGGREAVSFFLATGALICLAAFDDAYRLHESVAPEKLGVPQEVGLALLVVIAVAWAIRYRAALLRSESVLLGLGIAAIGVSVMVDVLPGGYGGIEDYAKFVGVATLFAWVVVEASRSLLEAAAGGHAGRAG